MIAMQNSYSTLKQSGSDLNVCQGQTIKDFFDQMGLQTAWEFDTQIEQFSKDAEHKSSQQES